MQHEELTPAPQRKRVFVIGGGPAGMEAARVAASRGHEVTLFERSSQLGGALIEAAIPKFKQDLRPLIDYLSTQVTRLGVKVNSDREVTPEEIVDGAPDVVIVATGSKPFVPKLPGIDKRHVYLGLDVLRGAKVGQTVVMIGGGLVSCELAWFLLDLGRHVIMTTRQEEIAYNMEIVHKMVIKDVLSKANVKMYSRASLQKITDEGVIMSSKEGQFAIAADSVVIMAGFIPNRDLGENLSQKGIKTCAVGDCIKPRGIHEAIYEGHLAALAI